MGHDCRENHRVPGGRDRVSARHDHVLAVLDRVLADRDHRKWRTSGHRGRGGPQTVKERMPAKRVASGEKGKPLSLKLAHFAEKSRGGVTIGWDFTLRVGSVVFMGPNSQ